MENLKLEQLVQKYYDRLFRAALFMCNEPEAAEDLVQDTFAAATDAIERFEGNSSPYTWLYGIFLNKFRTWLREKEKIKNLSLENQAENFDMGNVGELLKSPEPNSTEKLQQREKAKAVKEAMDKLPPHHKNVLVLKYLEGMSYEEISEVVDCSIGTVKSRMHYALKKIGRKLRNHPSVEGEP